MKWVPNGWRLESKATSFQEVFLNKVKPIGEKAPKKRTKIDFKAKVNNLSFKKKQRTRLFLIGYFGLLMSITYGCIRLVIFHWLEGFHWATDTRCM